jgi:hypothetical protein
MAANHPRLVAQRSKSAGGGRNNKRKRARLIPGTEFLNSRLLMMDPSNLLQSTSASSPHFAPLPARFSSAGVYYSLMQEMVVEEARATVADALRQQDSRRPHWLQCCGDGMRSGKAAPAAKSNKLETICFRFHGEGAEPLPRAIKDSCRPGSVWLLGAGYTPPPPQHSSRRGVASAEYLRQSARLAVVDGRERFHDGVLSLEMAGDFARALRSASAPVMLAAWPVGSVLAMQRMCDVCQRAPAPPFMHQILGERTREHITFGAPSCLRRAPPCVQLRCRMHAAEGDMRWTTGPQHPRRTRTSKRMLPSYQAIAAQLGETRLWITLGSRRSQTTTSSVPIAEKQPMLTTELQHPPIAIRTAQLWKG